MLARSLLPALEDHLPKQMVAVDGVLVGTAPSSSHIQSLDLESVDKAFQADVLKLGSDMAQFADFESRCCASARKLAISKVLKLKAEQRKGSQVIVEWMSRNARFVAGSYQEEHLNIAEAGWV